MADPADLKYSESHEWARLEGDVATVGITAFAVDQLSDITYVDLPRAGETAEAGQRFGEIESVKAVSDLVAPLTGEIVEVHEAVNDDPAVITKDPYGEGWLIRIKVRDRAELEALKSAEEYERLVSSDK
jgi:glycine cleavage system H protein